MLGSRDADEDEDDDYDDDDEEAFEGWPDPEPMQVDSRSKRRNSTQGLTEFAFD